jgi:hypothetical protein
MRKPDCACGGGGLGGERVVRREVVQAPLAVQPPDRAAQFGVALDRRAQVPDRLCSAPGASATGC